MYIKRAIHQKIRNHLGRKEYTIITGARQTGKTSLIKALNEEIQNEYDIVRYISLEDMDVLAALDAHPEEIFSFIPRPEKPSVLSQTVSKPFILFIDEVQYAANPSNFLKYLYDTYGENLKIIATGSSAFYIDNKFTDSLAGRKRIFELKTLDFEEWLRFKKFDVLLEELNLIRSETEYVSTVRNELLEKFDEFLIYGGYPAIALEEDDEEKESLLKDIKNSFLKRDVDESAIKYPDRFYNLLTLLAGQTGNLANRNELAGTIGVDNKTIDKYLYVLQKCFHVGLVKPFYSNVRKEISKMPKVYFNDLGMRNIALNRLFKFRDREDKRQLLENYVYRRLADKFEADNIRFWRTIDKKGIDFVVRLSSGTGMAYEVKMLCKPMKRSLRDKFEALYPDFPLQVISHNISQGCEWVLKL